MSTEIENKVVSITFNNKSFDSDVKDTISTLDKLKSKLSFKNNGFDEVSKSASNVDLSSMAKGIDTISSRFSTMGIIGMRVITRLTDAAINLGKRFASALTITPMKDGFGEYETKMGAITTIMTNTNAAGVKLSDSTMKSIEAQVDATMGAVGTASSGGTDAIRESQEEQMDILMQSSSDEIDLLQRKQDDMDSINNDAYNSEMDILNEGHDAKMKMYNDEYMLKLKIIDEEKYNQLQSLNSQIDAIKGQMELDSELLRISNEKKRVAELTNRIETASTPEAQLKAAQNLTDYKDQLNREYTKREQKDEIESLNMAIEHVELNSQNKLDALNTEYNEKFDAEQKNYDESSALLTDKHNETMRLLDIEQDKEMSNLTTRLDAELDNLQKVQDQRLKNISAASSAEASSGASRSEQISELVNLEKAKLTPKVTTLDDVNAALAELNTYADKTIYNFAEMTKNVGTFTAAGIDLDSSVQAIKGIANLAAGSGSTSQQASTAMYQLSQALSSGSLKLMDWNSVVNANMGGALFQNALKDTAKEMGIVVDESVPFRESLTTGWATTEVLTATLGKLAKDESLLDAATEVKTITQLMGTLAEATGSGWSGSWEIVVGTFDEAKKTLTDISTLVGGLIDDGATARNNMLKSWKALGGRTKVIKSLRLIFDSLVSTISEVKKAFDEVFPPMTGRKLFSLTYKFWEFARSLKMGEESLEKVHKIAKGVFSVLGIGVKVVKFVANAFFDVIKAINPLSGGFIDTLETVSDKISLLYEKISKGGLLEKKFGTLKDVLVTLSTTIGETILALLDVFVNLGLYLTEKTPAALDFFVSGFTKFTSKIKEGFDFLKEELDSVNSLFDLINHTAEKTEISGGGVKQLVAAVKPMNAMAESLVLFEAAESKSTHMLDGFLKKIEQIKPYLKKAGLAVLEFISTLTLDDLNKIMDLALKGFAIKGINSVTKFIGKKGDFFDNIGKTFDGFLGSWNRLIGALTDTLETMQNNIKADTLMKIAKAIGIMTIAIIALSFIDTEKMLITIGAIGGMLAELLASMTILGKLDTIGITATLSLSVGMIGLSIALSILATAMVKISKLNLKQMALSLSAVGIMMVELIASMELLSLIPNDVTKKAKSLIIVSLAIVVLSTVVKKLGEMDMDDLAKGLIGVSTLLGGLAIFTKLTQADGMSFGSGLGLLLMAAAITVLSKLVYSLAIIDTKLLLKGLAAISALLLELAIFAKMTNNSKTLISTGIALVIIAYAMRKYAGSLEELGSIDNTVLLKGLAGFAAIIILLAISQKALNKTKFSSTLSLLAMSAALHIFAGSLEEIGKMSLKSLAKGLVAITIALGVFAIALNVMSGTMTGALALTAAAIAIAILAPTLLILSAIPLLGLAIGLGAIVAVLGILGLSAVILGPLLPVLAGLTVILGGLSLVVLTAGVGLSILSVGLATLAVSGAAGMGVLFVGLKSLITLIPKLLEAVALGIVKMAELLITNIVVFRNLAISLFTAIAEGFIIAIPTILQAVGTLILNTLQVMRDTIPDIVATALELIVALLTVFAQNMYRITILGVDMVLSIIAGINDKMAEFVQAAFNTLICFIGGLALAIDKNAPAIAKVTLHLIVSIVTAIFKLLWKIVNIGKDLIDSFIEGIWSKFESAKESISNFFGGIVDKVKEILGINSPSRVFAEIGEYSGDGFINGMDSKKDEAKTTAESFTSEMLSGMTGYEGDATLAGEGLTNSMLDGLDMDTGMDTFGGIGELFGDSFTGALDTNGDAETAGGDLSANALIGVDSNTDEFVNVGSNAGEGFVNGILEWVEEAAKAAKKLSTAAMDSATDTLAIHSPSRVFMGIGAYTGQGFVNGLLGEVDNATNASKSLATKSIEAIREAISNTNTNVLDDITPTITPIIDLTKVKEGFSSLKQKNMKLNFNGMNNKTTDVGNNQNGSNSKQVINNYEFTQTNNSPKELSRIDIYRNTRNQLRELEVLN